MRRKPTAPQAADSFRPLTPERWRDVEALFGERGACGGCWCMAWRLPRARWEALKGQGNRRAFRRLVASGAAPGVLAYADGRAVGWCAVAPRPAYAALARSRVLKPVDEAPVWSVSCLFVAKSHRRQGLSAALLRAADAFARSRGARIVEGYPVETARPLPDPFVWTGLASAFRRAGFVEVARRSPTRPIMRSTAALAPELQRGFARQPRAQRAGAASRAAGSKRPSR